MDRDNDNPHSIKEGDYVHYKKFNTSSHVLEIAHTKTLAYLENVGWIPIADLELAIPPKVMYIKHNTRIIELPNGILLYKDDKNVFQLNSLGLGALKWHQTYPPIQQQKVL